MQHLLAATVSQNHRAQLTRLSRLPKSLSRGAVEAGTRQHSQQPGFQGPGLDISQGKPLADDNPESSLSSLSCPLLLIPDGYPEIPCSTKV